ncbi:AzlD domain-containing protein [Sphaerochaeta sp. PS]|uniref:AzlD domain-containing protein n=1 Tax=Sphaerochaeta sp. PS TaxID=3076336 RepID=UPI0028A398FF|nr:AzlD domain-containing protein [Sphaerochaeta sp. PS]MDT4762030.1 AzlD domain-containing protein [Sphaerochaeta sp. PS]
MNGQIPIFVYILATAGATFAVRLTPYYAKFLNKLPRFVGKCMRLLPIAALGPLVFPGVILDFSPQWYAGLAGIAASFLIAYKKGGMILPILSSVLVTYLVLLV